MGRSSITVALVGNPNSGKTTVFNNLTGSHQHVGNWPGVTVEKKEGQMSHAGYDMTVVDLPGVYGLTAYSLDEVITRDFLLDARPEVVVNVVDASNLERNLYLTVQLLEMGLPVVVALNMMDEAESRRFVIDVDKIGALLGAPVVPMAASKNRGTKELIQAIVSRAASTETPSPLRVRYGREIEEEIAKLQTLIESSGNRTGYHTRWLALKLLEQDEGVAGRLKETGIEQRRGTPTGKG